MNSQTIANVEGPPSTDPARAAKQWLVRFGTNVVGPVSLDLIEQGLLAGKIPAGADMAHVERRQWWPIAECFPYRQSPSVAPAADPSLAASMPAMPPPMPVPAMPSGMQAQAQVPPPPPSYRFPEEPVSIPKQGLWQALFG